MIQKPSVVIIEALGRALTETGLMPESGIPDFVVEHPKDEVNGDYASNIAMVIWKQFSNLPAQAGPQFANSQIKSPREVAQLLVTSLQKDTVISSLIDTTRISVAGPGFINFYLKTDYLMEQARMAIEPGYGRSDSLAGQRVMVEYTDPNPFKEMHIGHLMSNTIGQAISNLLAMQGAEVKRVCYQGDVGLHVAKAVWGMIHNSQTSNSQIANWTTTWAQKSLPERQKMMGAAYAMGATKYEEDETAKAEMHEINKKIYEKTDPVLNELYQAGRTWSLEYFETIYNRLGTKFDHYFFESEAGEYGLKVITDGLAQGVLELGDGGAVVYRGEQDGLHTRVFRNKLGLPTYEGKELGLAIAKYEKYKYDLSYIVTANEIDEYFKVLLKVMTRLYPELGSRTHHRSHGVMKLTSGKMSSRTGKVVTAEGLLNDLRDVVVAKIGERDITDRDIVADQVAVGALKYTVLKQALGGDIVYDPDKMTNLEGATGPYIQYAYARARSVLAKFKIQNNKSQTNNDIAELQVEEMALLRWIYRYPEVVEEAGRVIAPHMIAGYTYELAARFSTFYQNCRVEEEGVVNPLRYQLTQAVSIVLLSGLGVLGIRAPEEM